MAKLKVNSELLRIMDDYNLFMSSEKKTEMPIIVSKEKPNHKTSLYKEQLIECDISFGETKMDCEIREKNPSNFSFQLVSNKLSNRVIARLDEGNGVHRNNLPHIPLAEQQVTTPHFHKYDDSGFFIAYKPASLDAYENRLNIKEGLHVFCEEEKIESLNDNTVEILIKEDGVFPFEHDKDPLNGIMF